MARYSHTIPQKWILTEAIKAHTTEDSRRIVEQWFVIDTFTEFYPAMDLYKQIHKRSPQREMYVVHTNSQEVQIKVRRWLGIRNVQF